MFIKVHKRKVKCKWLIKLLLIKVQLMLLAQPCKFIPFIPKAVKRTLHGNNTT